MIEFEQYLPGILLSLSAVMLALMSPGANILAVIGTSMSVGRRQGVMLAIGVGCGTFVWMFVAVLGLTALVAQYAAAMTTLKIFGGLYLLWLGYKSFRSAAVNRELDASAILLPGTWAFFRRGLAVQLTNPKAALANLAIVSIGTHVGAPLWVGGSIVVGATCLSVIGHIVYALCFSTQPMIVMYRKARRYIEAAFGAFFCFVGYELLTEKA